MAGFKDVCEAVDTFEKDQQFNQDDIAGLSGASKSLVQSYFPHLVKIGDLQRFQGRPYKYSRLADMSEKFAAGLYDGFFTKARAGRIAEMQGSVEDEEIEVDPLEIFEQMEPDDFGKLVSLFVQRKRAALEPLVEQVKHFKQELELQESRSNVHSNTLEGTIRQLREELKTERATVMGLRDELFKERERHAHVDREAPIRTILIKDRPINKDSSATNQASGMGGNFQRVKMHKRPHQNHPHKAVVEHRKHHR